MKSKTKINYTKPAHPLEHQNQIGAVVSQTRGAASLRTFAQQVGVSHVQIRNWETGSQRPPVATLARLHASRAILVREMATMLLNLYRAEIDAILGETKS